MLRGERHHVWTSKSTSSPVIWVGMIARQVHAYKHIQATLLCLYQGTNMGKFMTHALLPQLVTGDDVSTNVRAVWNMPLV